MTNLSPAQEEMLANVGETYEEVARQIQATEDDYAYALYNLKTPVRDAVEHARNNGVPMNRIAPLCGNMYAQKLNRWLSIDPGVLIRRATGEVRVTPTVREEVKEIIEHIETVTRNPQTGVFTVQYDGQTHKVQAYGPDEEAWASPEDTTPPEVYELIKDKHPGFVVVEDVEDFE